jgi:hypothetical protein
VPRRANVLLVFFVVALSSVRRQPKPFKTCEMTSQLARTFFCFGSRDEAEQTELIHNILHHLVKRDRRNKEIRKDKNKVCVEGCYETVCCLFIPWLVSRRPRVPRCGVDIPIVLYTHSLNQKIAEKLIIKLRVHLRRLAPQGSKKAPP